MRHAQIKPLPQTVYVFEFDEDVGKPLYAVVTDPADLPDDVEGNLVGEYGLIREKGFRVRRELYDT